MYNQIRSLHSEHLNRNQNTKPVQNPLSGLILNETDFNIKTLRRDMSNISQHKFDSRGISPKKKKKGVAQTFSNEITY